MNKNYGLSFFYWISRVRVRGEGCKRKLDLEFSSPWIWHGMLFTLLIFFLIEYKSLIPCVCWISKTALSKQSLLCDSLVSVPSLVFSDVAKTEITTIMGEKERVGGKVDRVILRRLYSRKIYLVLKLFKPPCKAQFKMSCSHLTSWGMVFGWCSIF